MHHVRVAADDLKNRRCSARSLCCCEISTNILSLRDIFFVRHCERSEAIQKKHKAQVWIASSLRSSQ
jgi:hypothetical protein